ncbi:MAG: radical SAM protein [Mariprofundaceae bacterium]|nr:radical SAM protein [Mariprofundaceae bacterium]
MSHKKTFRVVLIKPSHYDDDGYVIQWYRSAVPSNTLASMYGLTQDLIARKTLGEDVDIFTDSFDETNTRIPMNKIIRSIQSADAGFVGFAGVQSNQFPRSMDMARVFRKAGLQVCIGGFHVSGCLSMLPELPADIREAQELGISLFAGEAEGRLEEVFADAYAGTMKPLYNYLGKLPDVEGEPTPFLPASMLTRSMGSLTSFDAGRGCPFVCSFCTIINVQGRKSSRRSADDIEKIVRMNAAQGVTRFFITDDNFARNRDWEDIFDRLIMLQEKEGMTIRLTIQVDTMSHKIARFIEKAGKAGVRRAFIGLENINPDNLKAAGKKQNKITEYRKLMQAWRNVGVMTCAGYILGFPGDTPEQIIKDIEVIKRELPVDLLEFFFLTPLPGSADHKALDADGTWMDPDMNKYDLNHVTTGHANMSRKDWEQVYNLAWDTYYTPEHIETVLKRARASGISVGKMMFLMLWFYGCHKFEGLHPLEGGYFRRKYRLDRRPGMPIENPLLFFPRRMWETIRGQVSIAVLLLKFSGVYRRIKADPRAFDYTDTALTPVSETENDDDSLEMLVTRQA